jgi:hypothetical protein
MAFSLTASSASSVSDVFSFDKLSLKSGDEKRKYHTKPDGVALTEEFYEKYERCESPGGIVYRLEEELKILRKVSWEIVKGVGQNIMEGKELVSLSMPVQMFRPRSLLEHMADLFCFAPQFLTLAAGPYSALYVYSLCYPLLWL